MKAITLLLAVFILLACEKKPLAEDFAAEAAFTLGQIEFSTHHSEWQALKPRQKLHWGDGVRTGSASKLMLSFFQKMLITLTAQTQVEILKGDAQENFTLKLIQGRLDHEAAPLKGSYQLRTPALTLSVRGTRFSAETDGKTDRVKVSEGSVAVKRNLEGFEAPETLLKPGDEIEVRVQENTDLENRLKKGETPNLTISARPEKGSQPVKTVKPVQKPEETKKPAGVSRSRNRALY